jgi:hypothetical protein
VRKALNKNDTLRKKRLLWQAFFAWWEAAPEGVSLSISMFCTNGAFSPCKKCKKSLSIKSAMREDATKIYLNKESAPCSLRQKAVCFKQTGQRPAQRDKSNNTM